MSPFRFSEPHDVREYLPTKFQIQEKEGISDERACDILAMLIGAGADTTSSYLQSFFKVMALHPDVVRKAHEGKLLLSHPPI